MNGQTLTRQQRAAIVDCARHCEHAAGCALLNEIAYNVAAAENWRERAEWWASQAMREVDAALAEQALLQVAA